MPITVNGQTISDQQIKDFYAQGGDDVQWFQQNSGSKDLWEQRDLLNKAREIAGPGTMQGDSAINHYYDMYKKYVPGGAFQNDYAGFVNDIKANPAKAAAIQSGAYTGQGWLTSRDSDFGGVLGPGGPLNKIHDGSGNGFGALGNGGGWDANSSSSQNLGMGSSGGYSGGGGYSGSSSSSSTSGGQNPYLQEMGNTIVNQMTDNYNRNQLPAMRSGAVAAGGFGGSRQGVVESNGLRDLNMGIGQNLTSLYGQDWTNAQNRNLQQQSINNSYDLGLKSNDLGYANLDSNNSQFGANYGLNVLNAQNQWAQNGVQATTNMQNTPANYQTMFSNNQNAIAGQGGTQTNTQNNQGNPWLGALGGFQLANQAIK